MTLTATLTGELKRLTLREKAALADHLWREVEGGIGPTPDQLAELNRRAADALKNPKKLRSPSELVRRIRR
jgi:putative addiction module component (TIGR02574 family)